ncbi:hypothetical protein [Streptomyces sp. R21]|uniref:hypothetical protein n=1 Tax=Streptomyces sp. R21 TaxID=3238627 RepID=UPI0034DF743B
MTAASRSTARGTVAIDRADGTQAPGVQGALGSQALGTTAVPAMGVRPPDREITGMRIRAVRPAPGTATRAAPVTLGVLMTPGRPPE